MIRCLLLNLSLAYCVASFYFYCSFLYTLIEHRRAEQLLLVSREFYPFKSKINYIFINLYVFPATVPRILLYNAG